MFRHRPIHVLVASQHAAGFGDDAFGHSEDLLPGDLMAKNPPLRICMDILGPSSLMFLNINVEAMSHLVR